MSHHMAAMSLMRSQDMSADFDTLKSKGHKPFYRGSLLKFRHADRHAHAGGMGQLELQMPKFSAT